MKIQEVRLKLFKEKFKFSAAHFLIFDEQRAERLHGHNYRVRLDVKVPEKDLAYSSKGFYIDFSEIKKEVAGILFQWDEKVLLPDQHQDFKFRQEGDTLHVNFRDRYYAFPVNEVERLALSNTSVEELSRLLAEKILHSLSALGVEEICVEVEETPGQSAQTSMKRTNT